MLKVGIIYGTTAKFLTMSIFSTLISSISFDDETFADLPLHQLLLTLFFIIGIVI